MENQLVSKPKKKWKRVTTNLTTSKKSKRYRASKLCIKQNEREQHLSTSSSDSDISNSSHSNSETESVTNLPKSNNLVNFSTLVKPLKKDKSTQVLIKQRNCCLQYSPHLRSKYAQTATDTKTNCSTSTQYSNPLQTSLHANKLLTLLNEGDAFSKFAEIIHSNEQTNKFVKCVQSIAFGNLETTNLAWKSFLDMGTLFSLKSTTQMEYDPEWLEFCQVIYHMFGAGVVNALRGCGHFSQVT